MPRARCRSPGPTAPPSSEDRPDQDPAIESNAGALWHRGALGVSRGQSAEALRAALRGIMVASGVGGLPWGSVVVRPDFVPIGCEL
eukprot:4995832-Lingulodinium_polyedra.AAC.1